MKNIITILLSMALVISFTFAEKIQITKAEIIRSAVMAKDNVGIAKPGDTFTVMEEIGAWHFIKLNDGVNAGASGWVWQNLLDTKNLKIKGDTTAQGVPGVNLHVDPITYSQVVATATAGVNYTLVKILVRWYKIAEGKYIYYYNTKKISE